MRPSIVAAGARARPAYPAQSIFMIVPIQSDSAKRFPGLPELSAIAEAGLPGSEHATRAGSYAPKGPPRAVRERLQSEAPLAVADPPVRDKLLALGLEPAGSWSGSARAPDTTGATASGCARPA
jgi:hypothetical protein